MFITPENARVIVVASGMVYFLSVIATNIRNAKVHALIKLKNEGIEIPVKHYIVASILRSVEGGENGQT